jgi:receptor expression-enhancing protein 5/6
MTEQAQPPTPPPKPSFFKNAFSSAISLVNTVVRRGSQNNMQANVPVHVMEKKHGEPPVYTFVPNTDGESVQIEGKQQIEGQTSNLPMVRRINEAMEKYWVFRFVEERAGISRLYQALFLTVCAAILGIYLIGLRKTSNTIAFVYPAYMSYKTLEANNYEDHLHWLTYWVVYGVLDIMHGVFDAIFYWVPYYEALKFAFLFWLFLPRTRGCAAIYNVFVRPILRSNEESIDNGLDAAGEKAKKVSVEVRSMSGELIATILALMFKTIATGVHTIGDSAASLSGNQAPSASNRERRPSEAVPADFQKKQN